MSDSLFDGIFDQPRLRTPKDVLSEFASKIEQESRVHLTGEIKDLPVQNPNVLNFTFGIKSLATSYTYNLMAIYHDVLMYPCIIATEQLIIDQAQLNAIAGTYYVAGSLPVNGVRADDEAAFVDIITGLLKTNRSKNIVRAIYSQA